MANGPLSPVMLIASSGLLQNQGIEIASNLPISINSYSTTDIVSTYQAVLDNAITANLSTTVVANLQSLGSNSIPTLTNVIPSDYLGTLLNISAWNSSANYFIGNVVSYENAIWTAVADITGNAPPEANYWAPNNSATRFTPLILPQAQELISGDISIFIQSYSQAQGYQSTVNQFINSSKNTTSLDATFIDMNALTTGGISLVTNDTVKFGADLAKLGKLINLAELATLGFPSTLVRQMFNVGGLLPAVNDSLALSGITTADLNSIAKSTIPLAGSLESRIYEALTYITGDNLKQVTFLLDVETENINTMADLLNPVKILPNSYLNLTVQTVNGTLPIYSNADTINNGIQSTFNNDVSYQELKKIIPPDQALANRAWVRSLYQVKNILALELPSLAIAVSATETNLGLSDINSLTETVPESVKDSLKTELNPNIAISNGNVSSGTGPNGTLTLSDFVGTAAGIPYVAQLELATTTIDAMQTRGWLSSLTDTVSGIFPQMNNTLLGVYGNAPVVIPTGPAAGTYANVDIAFESGLISNAISAIGNITAMYPQQSTDLTNNFTLMADQLVREPINLAAAGINSLVLPANNKTALMSFATSLHDVGQDIAPGGQNNIISAMANSSSQTGQAIIASLREGRNITALNDAGITTDTQLSST